MERVRVNDWASDNQQSHSPVEGEWQVVVRPLLSSNRRPHFGTHKVWKEQKYGHGSQWGPKPRLTVLARASSSLLDGPWVPQDSKSKMTVLARPAVIYATNSTDIGLSVVTQLHDSHSRKTAKYWHADPLLGNDSVKTFPRQRIRRQQSDNSRCYATRCKYNNRGSDIFYVVRHISIAGQRMYFLWIRLEDI
jgi:hypothetical protein